MMRSWTSMAYSVGRVQTISSYFVLEAVIPRQENCTSACMNQIQGFAGQDAGNYIATAATLVPGSSIDMLVSFWIVSHTKKSRRWCRSRSGHQL